MQEQMEANKKMMEEQNKTWEEKLAEAKARFEEEEKAKKAQNDFRSSGLPYITNLNEDSQLDRKVAYEIKQGEELTCGRRKKGSSHRL